MLRRELIKGLTKDDLEVFEDRARQTISHFSQGGDTGRNLEEFRKTTLQTRDWAFLLCFGNNPRLVSAHTNRIEQITDDLREYQDRKSKMTFPRVGPTEQREQGTALFDAIYYGAEGRRVRSDGRRALLVFSDGEENASARGR